MADEKNEKKEDTLHVPYSESKYKNAINITHWFEEPSRKPTDEEVKPGGQA